ncbi:protein FAM110A [Fundulus heteroclitus]|uniref:protein FAM110A n=1 Tax=Fundulus heteroclitus TaxID=8078 RepID=UPI00165BCDB4|nr:protein FAM110A [Fundulus heteroclitus]XP_021178775.2 protein FAM110A [Fundulus heteroclitus]
MPVEALQHPSKPAAKAAIGVSPPRLRPKGPVGPDFYRRTAAGAPKQSAVERLEADKAKYVKSQVALTKQQPVRAPEMKKPLLNPCTPLRPTRKTPTQAKAKQEGVQLDLEHLTSLISDLPNGPQSKGAAGSGDGTAPDAGPAAHGCQDKAATHTQQVKERPCPPPRPDWSSPAKVRLKASGPAKVDSPAPPGAPAAGTVRRVDVIPQAGPVKASRRPPQYVRQPLQPVALPSQFPLRPAASRQRLLIQKITPGSPLKPPVAPKPENWRCPPAEPSAPASPAFAPPPSPAITRLSSGSSRKRPSLTRSKSDMSDRYSRADTELERFFNLCGLEPADLQELRASSSDIVSLARFRSVSAPGSECAGSKRGSADEEEDEEAGKAAERVPYGVSVIERNARVIKWLYGLRQAKENTTKSTNL